MIGCWVLRMFFQNLIVMWVQFSQLKGLLAPFLDLVLKDPKCLSNGIQLAITLHARNETFCARGLIYAR